MGEVFEKYCQTCHGGATKAGASISLVTWDDLQKEHGGKKVVDLVKQRIHAETGRMPPAARLADSELEALDRWIEGGATKSDATCGGAATTAAKPFTCASPGKTTLLTADKPYNWEGTPTNDRYVCFGFDETVSSKRHAITFGPIVDNASILHHISIYQTKESVPREAQPCQAIAAASWTMIAGWGPGGDVFDLAAASRFPDRRDDPLGRPAPLQQRARDLSDQKDQSEYEDLRDRPALSERCRHARVRLASVHDPAADGVRSPNTAITRSRGATRT